MLMISGFQLFCAEILINDPGGLFDQLDRGIKAGNIIQIETLFLQPSFTNLTQSKRNNLFERSLFFHTDEKKEVGLFLLEKQKVLKVNLLGIRDILRLSVSMERPDVTNFVLFQITDESLRPEKSVVEACKRSAEERKNIKLIKVFNDYLNPKPQSTMIERASAILPVAEDFSKQANISADSVPITPSALIEEQEERKGYQVSFSDILTFLRNNIT